MRELIVSIIEPPHDKTNKMACAPSEDSDQTGHQSLHCPHEESCVLSYPLSAQRRLLSDWADGQADLSLRGAHSHFVDFVIRRINLWFHIFFFFLLVPEEDTP